MKWRTSIRRPDPGPAPRGTTDESHRDPDVAGGLAVLRFERRYPHPVQKVWRAITGPAHLARWLPADMRMDPGVGAKIHFVFREGEADESDGEITALDPPRLFEFT